VIWIAGLGRTLLVTIVTDPTDIRASCPKRVKSAV
jgi:hypothetical protein